MERFTGKAICQKTAIGRIWFYSKTGQSVSRYHVEDSNEEWRRYERAREQAAAQLDQLYQEALKEVGEVNAAIFEVHAMMLEDEDYNDSVHNMIDSQKVNAEFAVASTGDNFASMFSNMEDDYFQARAADVKDISERILDILMNRRANKMGEEPVIIAAKDLAPSETVQMDKSRMLGFVTELGSANSHTAILARTMGIPAIIGVPACREWDGHMAVIDGDQGILYIDPDEQTLSHYREKQKEEMEKAKLLLKLKDKETITTDGRRIHLYANIGHVSDVAGVLENDAEGIGLLRSEFLYLEKDTYPTEEELFHSYKMVAEMMAGKRVIIRTLDIGADKQADYFKLGREENPAMGYRAIRICLEEPQIFRTQLRAIYRASIYGRVAIMYPMITSTEEIRQIKTIVREVLEELREQKIPFGEVEQGIMIETPAAAIISDLLAAEVDFFSIGTNDLSQYTLAIDRQNTRLDRFYDPHHPAIMRLIRTVIENGHKSGCWVGICGELGADLSLTEEFVNMGIDELSVNAGSVLAVRDAIRNI